MSTYDSGWLAATANADTAFTHGLGTNAIHTQIFHSASSDGSNASVAGDMLDSSGNRYGARVHGITSSELVVETGYSATTTQWGSGTEWSGGYIRVIASSILGNSSGGGGGIEINELGTHYTESLSAGTTKTYNISQFGIPAGATHAHVEFVGYEHSSTENVFWNSSSPAVAGKWITVLAAGNTEGARWANTGLFPVSASGNFSIEVTSGWNSVDMRVFGYLSSGSGSSGSVHVGGELSTEIMAISASNASSAGDAVSNSVHAGSWMINLTSQENGQSDEDIIITHSAKYEVPQNQYLWFKASRTSLFKQITDSATAPATSDANWVEVTDGIYQGQGHGNSSMGTLYGFAISVEITSDDASGDANVKEGCEAIGSDCRTAISELNSVASINDLDEFILTTNSGGKLQSMKTNFSTLKAKVLEPEAGAPSLNEAANIEMYARAYFEPPTMTIHKQEGFASIEKIHGGRYKFTFNSPLPDTNYTVLSTQEWVRPLEDACIVIYSTKTTSSFEVGTSNDNSSWADANALNVVVFR